MAIVSRICHHDDEMKLATYNVNGINGRLPVLLRWLEQSAPDVACFQELKSSQEKFPADAIEKAGYGAIWHGQKSWNGVAILARGRQPEETQRGLPGDPDDSHSRYIEAVIDGIVIGCLYLPNGNPAPGPKFDYKLKWFERLATYAKGLVAALFDRVWQNSTVKSFGAALARTASRDIALLYVLRNWQSKSLRID